MRININQLHTEWLRAGPETERGLYVELGEAVYEYVQRILKREFGTWYRVLQEDAVQETALEVFKDIAKFDPSRADFEQWIYGVTCHTCIDMLRQRRHQSEWGLLDHEALAGYHDYTSKHTLDKLRVELSEGENELVDLQLEGRSHAQVAVALECTERAAESKWYRLCLKLRTLLGGMETANVCSSDN